jgi:murein DD-endopeptidase MepM/ murein hydrolase activator NlpD
MNKLSLRAFIIVLFASAMFIFGAGFVFTQSTANPQETGGNKEEIDELNRQISERKKKIEELENTINKYKKSIEEKRLESVSLKNQLSILDNRLAQIETDIELTKEKISEASLEINALELSIKDKEAVIEKQKLIISKIVRNIHAEDQKDYIEVLLTSENFAEFYDQVKYLESVYTDLGRSVKKLRFAKEELSNKKIQVESRKQVYENLKIDLDNKKYDLNSQANVKQNLLANSQSSELRYKTLVDNLRAQYQAIEGEVRSYEIQVRKKLEELERFADLGVESGKFFWPVISKYVTSYFHDPEYPYRHVFEHSGIDIRAAQGTPIKAANSGYVARAKRCSVSTCYSYVLLIHSGNLSTVYGHMSSIAVNEDQFVAKGDILGYSGGTPGTVGAGPFVTGPHLHFEVRLNGIPVNPMNYF